MGLGGFSTFGTMFSKLLLDWKTLRKRTQKVSSLGPEIHTKSIQGFSSSIHIASRKPSVEKLPSNLHSEPRRT